MAEQEQPLSDKPASCPEGCGDDLTVHSTGLGCWLCDRAHDRELEPEAEVG